LLPWSDRRSELTFLAVGHWFDHGVRATGMYTALRWASQATPLPWSREQRFLLQTHLAF
jgi:hypothetical protein